MFSGAKVFIFFVIASLISWGASSFTMKAFTKNGTLFEDIVTSQQKDYVEKYEEGDTLLTVTSSGGSLEFDLKKSDTAITVISINKAETSIQADWLHSVILADNLKKLGLLDRRKGKAIFYGFSNTSRFMPYARETIVDVSPGALSTWFLEKYGVALDGAALVGDEDELELLSRFSAQLAEEKYDIRGFGDRASWVLMFSGKIQFITLFISFLAITLTIFGKLHYSLVSFGETMIELIPFSGFFGTLLGMSGALSILGVVNLSDDVSKSLNLGSIGSQLGLAIETTKFAIICYAVVTVLIILYEQVRNAAKGQEVT